MRQPKAATSAAGCSVPSINVVLFVQSKSSTRLSATSAPSQPNNSNQVNPMQPNPTIPSIQIKPKFTKTVPNIQLAAGGPKV